jgi:hypothetical protein
MAEEHWYEYSQGGTNDTEAGWIAFNVVIQRLTIEDSLVIGEQYVEGTG